MSRPPAPKCLADEGAGGRQEEARADIQHKGFGRGEGLTQEPAAVDGAKPIQKKGFRDRPTRCRCKGKGEPTAKEVHGR